MVEVYGRANHSPHEPRSRVGGWSGKHSPLEAHSQGSHSLSQDSASQRFYHIPVALPWVNAKCLTQWTFGGHQHPKYSYG